MTTDLEQQAVKQGYGITGYMGGQPKQRYWTPDGRMVEAMPDMHEYAIKKNGKVVSQGVRDANLDRWLASPPANPLPHCPHCDKWHNTQSEIDECGESRKRFIAKAIKEVPVDDDRIAKLEGDMSELKDMFKQMMEGMKRSTSSKKPSTRRSPPKR